MSQHYFDPLTHAVIYCDPATAPIDPSWVEVSAEDAAALRDQHIPKLPRKDQLLAAISIKESLATPRRLRDAVITGDSSFLVALEQELEVLRAELRSLGDTP